MSHVKIIIADDHQLFSDGLCLLLRGEEFISIVDIVSSGKELLDVLDKTTVDLILLDINMPRLDGLETLKKIKTYYSGINVIILSTYFIKHLIEKARSLGASGYLSKTTDKDGLIACIRKVSTNQTCFPDNLDGIDPNLFEDDLFIRKYNLTKRETEILSLLKKGHTNSSIATNLYLSIYTVETHRKNLMKKLKVNSPAALIKFIVENDL